MSHASPSASPADRASPHLVLVGLPGAGKSSAARRVARRTGRPFLDFDEEIERREGMTVERIFAERGEPYFRACELALTRELAAVGGMVLAPGGGWVTSPEAVALMRPRATLVYLRLRPEAALARLRRAHRVRPLLRTDDPLATMRRLLAEREPAYLSAHHVIDIARTTPSALVAELARLAGG